MKPIFNHRELLGYARTKKQAEKIVRNLVNVNNGWKVTVSDRDTRIIDLPEGYVYSIHP